MCLTLKVIMLPTWEVGEGYPLSAEHEFSLPQVPRDREHLSTGGWVQKNGFCPHHPGSALSRVWALFCLPQQKRDVYLLNPPSVSRAQAYQFSVRSMAKALPSPLSPYMGLRAISSSLLERKGHHFAWCMGFKIWGRRISCLFKYEMVPGFNLHRVTATNVCCWCFVLNPCPGNYILSLFAWSLKPHVRFYLLA